MATSDDSRLKISQQLLRSSLTGSSPSLQPSFDGPPIARFTRRHRKPRGLIWTARIYVVYVDSLQSNVRFHVANPSWPLTGLYLQSIKATNCLHFSSLSFHLRNRKSFSDRKSLFDQNPNSQISRTSLYSKAPTLIIGEVCSFGHGSNVFEIRIRSSVGQSIRSEEESEGEKK